MALLETAAKLNLENQPAYAAVSVLPKPQHMVVFYFLKWFYLRRT